jgi:LytS/YehU family sensor histidine kinase
MRLAPQMVGIAVIVAVNVGLLLPRLYFTRQRALYFLVAALLVVVLVAALHYGWPDEPPVDRPGPIRSRPLSFLMIRYLLPLLLALFGSSLVEVMRFAKYQEGEKIRAEREQLATELKFLKSQINPHFLFNSLNNIYTLALLKDDLTPESILRLSNMLRYTLYEAETDNVPLIREIQYLRDYVQLMQLKDSRGLNVSFSLDDSQPNLQIAPLLLITFVENAFKHGLIENVETGFIDVELKTEPGGVDFLVKNNYSPGNVAKDKAHGIGLANVRKRLELLYPGQHTFSAAGDGETFTASLSITLP